MVFKLLEIWVVLHLGHKAFKQVALVEDSNDKSLDNEQG